MNNFIGKDKKEKQIQTKKKYTIFTSIMNRLGTEKLDYLRLANSKKDNENKKKRKLS